MRRRLLQSKLQYRTCHQVVFKADIMQLAASFVTERVRREVEDALPNQVVVEVLRTSYILDKFVLESKSRGLDGKIFVRVKNTKYEYSKCFGAAQVLGQEAALCP